MTDNALLGETKITLQVSGNSLPQLFEIAAFELFKKIVNPEDVGEVLREKITVEAPDANGLLQGWVTALLRLASDQRILFKRARFQEFELERTGSGRLRAEIIGELVDPQRHPYLIPPSQLRCEQVALLNSSKSIEAQLIFISQKITIEK